jgi:hypothetical protein
MVFFPKTILGWRENTIIFNGTFHCKSAGKRRIGVYP